MAASSVTGTGPGESNGLQKPQHHSGCGCCSGKSDAAPPALKPRRGCVKRYPAGGGLVRHSVSGGAVRGTSCF